MVVEGAELVRWAVRSTQLREISRVLFHIWKTQSGGTLYIWKTARVPGCWCSYAQRFGSAEPVSVLPCQLCRAGVRSAEAENHGRTNICTTQ